MLTRDAGLRSGLGDTSVQTPAAAASGPWGGRLRGPVRALASSCQPRSSLPPRLRPSLWGRGTVPTSVCLCQESGEEGNPAPTSRVYYFCPCHCYCFRPACYLTPGLPSLLPRSLR